MTLLLSNFLSTSTDNGEKVAKAKRPLPMKNNNKSNEKYPKTSRCEALKNEFLHISHTAMFKLGRLFDMSALFSLNKFSDQTWGTLGALWGPAGLPGPPRAPCRRPRP